MNSLYKTFEKSKNDLDIVVLNSGKTIESRYDPRREAQKQYSLFQKNYDFYLLIGGGSGYLTEEILHHNPNAKILILELTQNDIDFISKSPCYQNINSNHIIFTDLNSLRQKLINLYIPAKYGDLKIVEQKPWLNEVSVYIPQIQNEIQKALNCISADYSVQSHFGKIWMTNIMNNLKLMETYNLSNPVFIDTSKECAVIAAGPTLDKSITKILNNKDKYFIISTDTAAQVLEKYNLYSNIVVSLDGQTVSYNHFMNKTNESYYCFDLTANSSACKKILEHNGKLSFFVSGHPFSTLVNYFFNSKIPALFSGAGTVTISALDLAIKSGFTKISIFGADFSYSEGKAYTKATYLDKLYNISSSRILSNEYQYDKLLFRTALENLPDKKKTTMVLTAYKESLESYLKQNNLQTNKIDEIYEITYADNHNSLQFEPMKVNFMDFINFINSLSDDDIEVALLPYISWLRKQKDNENCSFEQLRKLAHNFIVRYN